MSESELLQFVGHLDGNPPRGRSHRSDAFGEIRHRPVDHRFRGRDEDRLPPHPTRTYVVDHAEDENRRAHRHDPAGKTEDGTEHPVFERHFRHFEHLAHQRPEESESKEHRHHDAGSRDEHAGNRSEALERNTVREFGREIESEQNADDPTGYGERFPDDAANDADNGGKKEKRQNDPVDFRHGRAGRKVAGRKRTALEPEGLGSLRTIRLERDPKKCAYSSEIAHRRASLRAPLRRAYGCVLRCGTDKTGRPSRRPKSALREARWKSGGATNARELYC